MSDTLISESAVLVYRDDFRAMGLANGERVWLGI